MAATLVYGYPATSVALALMTMSWGCLIPVVAGLVPIVVIAVWISLDRKRQRQRFQAPQGEKLLRPPGYSLSVRLDEVVDRAVFKILTALALCAMAGAFLYEAGGHSGHEATLLLLAGSVWGIGGAYATLRAITDLNHGQNLRLGMRGEQAVAEALQEVADCGYRAFHDFPGSENWNIDHVVVGPPGVFLIETKTRNRVRPRRGQEQPSHVVYILGNALQFPSGQDVKAIPQAERNAKWLASHLTKKTGEKVEVDALVVLPGWFVEIKQPPPNGTMVINTTYLKGYLRRQPPKLPDAQVRRIIAALDEKCRDVEF